MEDQQVQRICAAILASRAAASVSQLVPMEEHYVNVYKDILKALQTAESSAMAANAINRAVQDATRR